MISKKKGLALLLFTIFCNVFFFRSSGPVASLLFNLGFFAFLVAVFVDLKDWHKFRNLIFISGGLLLFTGFTSINRANETIQTINHWVVIGFFIIITYLLAARIDFVRSVWELITTPFQIAVSYMAGFFDFISQILSTKITIPRSKSLSGLLSWGKTIGVGILLGLPGVFVLLFLFSNADPIFSKSVHDFFANIHWPEWLNLDKISPRVWYSVLVLMFAGPFLFIKKQVDSKSPFVFSSTHKFIHEMTVAAGLIAAVIGSFLIVQWKYIFANVAETNLSQFGVATYSEYVNRGFFELLFAAGFIYAIVWFGLLILRNRDSKRKTILPHVQIFILGEFGIFLISLFRRLWLYQHSHGLTIIRVYGGFLLVWILLMAAILFARHFGRKQWIKVEVIVTVLVFSIFSLFNTEDFIARFDPPTVNGRIDYTYLSAMSADGYEGWKKALNYAETSIGNLTKKTELLTKEDKRDIAYSGKVVYQMMRNYNYLIHRYGTPEEIKNYYLTIINHERKVHEELSKYGQEYFKSLSSDQLKQLDDEANRIIQTRMVPDRAFQQVSNPSNVVYGSLLIGQKGLDEWERKVNDGSQDPLQFASFDLQVDQSNLCDFSYEAIYINSLSNPSLAYSCSKTFYQIPFYNYISWDYPYKSQLPIGKQTGLDLIFNWNKQDVYVYKDLKDQRIMDKLISLQDEYFALREKIMIQDSNPEHWGFDVDLSFETPFLTRY